MFEKRTDLALEVHELRGKDSGISVDESVKDGIKITTARVHDESGERLSGKRIGAYVTLEVGKIWRLDNARFDAVTKILADEISRFVPEGDGCVLVAGLGNEEITPDSLGPRAVKRLLVTRHISSIDPQFFNTAGFSSVAAISPGVIGQTGIESAEIIKSVCADIAPKCVILIDSLASRRLQRLATTVQISDNGISPGSGVSNKRKELNSELLGAPVISIGVPTVVDAATLAYDILEEHNGTPDKTFESVIEKILTGDAKNMFVTPKDNDVIAEQTARLIANALNMALQNMEISEINEYLN